MQNNHITPLIITFNEAPNIARTLDKLQWANRIVIVDSFSTDETLDIVKNYPQVEVVQRKFTTFAEQCNFGLTQIKTDWVLSMDADYVLDDEMAAGLANFTPLSISDKKTPVAYIAKFKYAIFGKPLRGTMYPPRKVLYRKGLGKYADEGHGHRLEIEGETATLNGSIHHDDRKSFTHWLGSQDRYMQREVKTLLTTPLSKLSFFDRIRLMIVPAPFVAFLYCLIIKGGIFDGWHGWHYACQRAIAELVCSVRLIEAKYFSEKEAISTTKKETAFESKTVVTH